MSIHPTTVKFASRGFIPENFIFRFCIHIQKHYGLAKRVPAKICEVRDGLFYTRTISYQVLQSKFKMPIFLIGFPRAGGYTVITVIWLIVYEGHTLRSWHHELSPRHALFLASGVLQIPLRATDSRKYCVRRMNPPTVSIASPGYGRLGIFHAPAKFTPDFFFTCGPTDVPFHSHVHRFSRILLDNVLAW